MEDPRVFRVYGTIGPLKGPFVLHVSYPDVVILDNESKEKLVTFPIPFLRSYGQDNGVFMFEAGRRCPMGPNRFGFAVIDDHNIFAALDEDIRRGRRAKSANVTASELQAIPQVGSSQHPRASAGADSNNSRPAMNAPSQASAPISVVDKGDSDGFQNRHEAPPAQPAPQPQSQPQPQQSARSQRRASPTEEAPPEARTRLRRNSGGLAASTRTGGASHASHAPAASDERYVIVDTAAIRNQQRTAAPPVQAAPAQAQAQGGAVAAARRRGHQRTSSVGGRNADTAAIPAATNDAPAPQPKPKAESEHVAKQPAPAVASATTSATTSANTSSKAQRSSAARPEPIAVAPPEVFRARLESQRQQRRASKEGQLENPTEANGDAAVAAAPEAAVMSEEEKSRGSSSNITDAKEENGTISYAVISIGQAGTEAKAPVRVAAPSTSHGEETGYAVIDMAKTQALAAANLYKTAAPKPAAEGDKQYNRASRRRKSITAMILRKRMSADLPAMSASSDGSAEAGGQPPVREIGRHIKLANKIRRAAELGLGTPDLFPHHRQSSFEPDFVASRSDDDEIDARAFSRPRMDTRARDEHMASRIDRQLEKLYLSVCAEVEALKAGPTAASEEDICAKILAPPPTRMSVSEQEPASSPPPTAPMTALFPKTLHAEEAEPAEPEFPPTPLHPPSSLDAISAAAKANVEVAPPSKVHHILDTGVPESGATTDAEDGEDIYITIGEAGETATEAEREHEHEGSEQGDDIYISVDTIVDDITTLFNSRNRSDPSPVQTTSDTAAAGMLSSSTASSPMPSTLPARSSDTSLSSSFGGIQHRTVDDFKRVMSSLDNLLQELCTDDKAAVAGSAASTASPANSTEQRVATLRKDDLEVLREAARGSAGPRQQPAPPPYSGGHKSTLRREDMEEMGKGLILMKEQHDRDFSTADDIYIDSASSSEAEQEEDNGMQSNRQALSVEGAPRRQSGEQFKQRNMSYRRASGSNEAGFMDLSMLHRMSLEDDLADGDLVAADKDEQKDHEGDDQEQEDDEYADELCDDYAVPALDIIAEEEPVASPSAHEQPSDAAGSDSGALQLATPAAASASSSRSTTPLVVGGFSRITEPQPGAGEESVIVGGFERVSSGGHHRRTSSDKRRRSHHRRSSAEKSRPRRSASATDWSNSEREHRRRSSSRKHRMSSGDAEGNSLGMVVCAPHTSSTSPVPGAGGGMPKSALKKRTSDASAHSMDAPVLSLGSGSASNAAPQASPSSSKNRSVAAAPALFQAVALYNNKAEATCELDFRKGEIMDVMDTKFRGSTDWWVCRKGDLTQGAVPAVYVKKL